MERAGGVARVAGVWVGGLEGWERLGERGEWTMRADGDA